MLLTMYMFVYTHTHTHTHTPTCEWFRVTYTPKSTPLAPVRFPLTLPHQHNHFHWLLGYWSPYLKISIDIGTQIFQFPTQILKTSLQRGQWICVFPCPLVISRVAHRSCIHLQTYTAHQQRKLPEQMQGQQLCDWGWTGLLDTWVKRGTCARVRRCDLPNPAPMALAEIPACSSPL